MSQTIKVKVKYKNLNALKRAVERLGGRVLGEGTHSLFATNEDGVGFLLPGWRFPVVLRDDGALAYDDYHGRWGNVSDLETLQKTYTIAAAEQEAKALGWATQERDNGDLLVYHPSGGTLTITATGGVDAQGFVGTTCEKAASTLADAMGDIAEVTQKGEYALAEVLQQEVSPEDEGRER